jgi:hypothetical protein
MGGRGGTAAGAQPAPGGMPGYPGMRPGMGMYPGMPGAPGTPAAPAAARVEDPSSREADARALKSLGKAVKANFDNVPLEAALNDVAQSSGVDLIADWKSIEAAGVQRDTQVTLNLRQGASAEQVLGWVLRSAGGDALGFAIDHGVVVVAPQERIERMVITRAYPLASLADDGPAVEGLVRDTVAPNSWRESGGPASVRFFNGQLFVTATEPNHRQVERLLGLMSAQGVRPGGMPGMGGMMPGAAPGASQPTGLRR